MNDLIKLVNNVIFKKNYDISIDDNLLKLSSFHDLAHFIYPYTGDKQYEKVFNSTSFKIIKLDFIIDYLKDIFNENNIPFILLKGSVIRKIYPEPWMRNSSDIDILIKVDDIARVKNILSSNGFKLCNDEDLHHLTFLYNDLFHVEIHHNICKNYSSIDSVLINAWNHVINKEGCEYIFDNEFFMFHQIAHCFHHFINGGCGIIHIVDIFLLNQNLQYDESVFNNFLIKSNTYQFYKCIKLLAKYWFNNGLEEKILLTMEDYILKGGAYGIYEQANIANKDDRNTFLGILKRLFPPLELMKTAYPIINKYKILVPFIYLRRIVIKLFNLIFKINYKESYFERHTKKSKIDDNIKQMFDELNIN